MYTATLDDLQYQNEIAVQPGKTAFIDECGSFGFDFSKDGTSHFYVLCAIVVKDSDIIKMREKFTEIKKQNGYGSAELKSSKIGNDYNRRSRIMSMLLPIPFQILLLIANKQEFMAASPLVDYKKVFIKYLHQRLYDQLYHVFPKLKIIEDETGYSEFQKSFRSYVETHRPSYNLFNQYDFDYTDSKEEVLVQLADFIGGSIYKTLDDPNSPNYIEMLKGKIASSDEFPSRKEPFWGNVNPSDCKFDNQIYILAKKCANDYIDKFQKDTSMEKRSQIAFLRYLMFYVDNVSPNKFVSSNEIQAYLQDYIGERIKKNFLFRRIVAPLRDSGLILSSSNKGYKIPISVEDIITYLNQTHTTVAPMLHRMEVCRNLILQYTGGELDVLNDPVFSRYKNYFE